MRDAWPKMKEGVKMANDSTRVLDVGVGSASCSFCCGDTSAKHDIIHFVASPLPRIFLHLLGIGPRYDNSHCPTTSP